MTVSISFLFFFYLSYYKHKTIKQDTEGQLDTQVLFMFRDWQILQEARTDDGRNIRSPSSFPQY